MGSHITCSWKTTFWTWSHKCKTFHNFQKPWLLSTSSFQDACYFISIFKVLIFLIIWICTWNVSSTGRQSCESTWIDRSNWEQPHSEVWLKHLLLHNNSHVHTQEHVLLRCRSPEESHNPTSPYTTAAITNGAGLRILNLVLWWPMRGLQVWENTVFQDSNLERHRFFHKEHIFFRLSFYEHFNIFNSI